MTTENVREPTDNSGLDAGIAAREASKQALTETEAPEEHEGEQEEVAEGEQAESQNTPEESAAPEKDAQPRKKKAVERIKELTWEKHEALRKAEAAERRVAELEAASKPAPAATQDDADAEPTFESCDFDEVKYKAALKAHALREADKQRQTEARETEKKQLSEAFTARLTAFEKENPGAWEAATKAPMTLTPPMLEVIATSDHGPHIGVYLSRNLEEADRISKLSPIAAAAALGRIEASLSTARQSERKTTKAPPPVTNVSGAPAINKSYADLSMREYDEVRRKERAARG